MSNLWVSLFYRTQTLISCNLEKDAKSCKGQKVVRRKKLQDKKVARWKKLQQLWFSLTHCSNCIVKCTSINMTNLTRISEFTSNIFCVIIMLHISLFRQFSDEENWTENIFNISVIILNNFLLSVRLSLSWHYSIDELC